MSDFAKLDERIAAVERELAAIKSHSPKQRIGNPWNRLHGILANEPLVDEWKDAMEEYRRERDEEDRRR